MKPKPTCHSFRIRVAKVGLLLGLILVGLVGCNSDPRRPALVTTGTAPRPVQLFTAQEQAIAIAALRDWHRTLADPAAQYELDGYDRRMGKRFRQALSPQFPPLPPATNRGDPGFFTVALESIAFPDRDYGYVTLRVASQFEIAEHTYVYTYREEAWVLHGHVLVADSKIRAVLTDFSWDAYRRKHGIPQSNEPAVP